MQTSDELIIELYWRREERAIDETDKKYGKFLFRIAYNVLHDRLDCEECRNDTYGEIWNAIPPARPSAFPAFIARIARRFAINRYNEKTAKKRVPSELTDSLDDLAGTLRDPSQPENCPEAREIGRIINEYVAGLPERRRYVFIDRFYLSEPVEEIARDLGVSSATVYRDLDYLRDELKKVLEENEVYL